MKNKLIIITALALLLIISVLYGIQALNTPPKIKRHIEKYPESKDESVTTPYPG